MRASGTRSSGVALWACGTGCPGVALIARAVEGEYNAVGVAKGAVVVYGRYCQCKIARIFRDGRQVVDGKHGRIILFEQPQNTLDRTAGIIQRTQPGLYIHSIGVLVININRGHAGRGGVVVAQITAAGVAVGRGGAKIVIDRIATEDTLSTRVALHTLASRVPLNALRTRHACIPLRTGRPR